jgi:hypothetical protein
VAFLTTKITAQGSKTLETKATLLETDNKVGRGKLSQSTTTPLALTQQNVQKLNNIPQPGNNQFTATPLAQNFQKLNNIPKLPDTKGNIQNLIIDLKQPTPNNRPDLTDMSKVLEKGNNIAATKLLTTEVKKETALQPLTFPTRPPTNLNHLSKTPDHANNKLPIQPISVGNYRPTVPTRPTLPPKNVNDISKVLEKVVPDSKGNNGANNKLPIETNSVGNNRPTVPTRHTLPPTNFNDISKVLEKVVPDSKGNNAANNKLPIQLKFPPINLTQFTPPAIPDSKGNNVANNKLPIQLKFPPINLTQFTPPIPDSKGNNGANIKLPIQLKLPPINLTQFTPPDIPDSKGNNGANNKLPIQLKFPPINLTQFTPNEPFKSFEVKIDQPRQQHVHTVPYDNEVKIDSPRNQHVHNHPIDKTPLRLPLKAVDAISILNKDFLMGGSLFANNGDNHKSILPPPPQHSHPTIIRIQLGYLSTKQPNENNYGKGYINGYNVGYIDSMNRRIKNDNSNSNDPSMRFQDYANGFRNGYIIGVRAAQYKIGFQNGYNSASNENKPRELQPPVPAPDRNGNGNANVNANGNGNTNGNFISEFLRNLFGGNSLGNNYDPNHSPAYNGEQPNEEQININNGNTSVLSIASGALINRCAVLNQKEYNCAGMAFQTCTFLGDRVNDVETHLSKMTSIDCLGICKPRQFKFWYWPHDLATLTKSTGARSKSHEDFHIVGGQTDNEGKGPSKVISKNGPRIVEKLNTPESFEPRNGDSFRKLSGEVLEDQFEIITNKKRLCYCSDALPGIVALESQNNNAE